MGLAGREDVQCGGMAQQLKPQGQQKDNVVQIAAWLEATVRCIDALSCHRVIGPPLEQHPRHELQLFSRTLPVTPP